MSVRKAKENGPSGGGGASAGGGGGGSTNALGSIPNGRLISRKRRGAKPKIRRAREGDNAGNASAKALIGRESLSPAQETLRAIEAAHDYESFLCCGGTDEHPPMHCQDCPDLQGRD